MPRQGCWSPDHRHAARGRAQLRPGTVFAMTLQPGSLRRWALRRPTSRCFRKDRAIDCSAARNERRARITMAWTFTTGENRGDNRGNPGKPGLKPGHERGENQENGHEGHESPSFTAVNPDCRPEVCPGFRPEVCPVFDQKFARFSTRSVRFSTRSWPGFCQKFALKEI